MVEKKTKRDKKQKDRQKGMNRNTHRHEKTLTH